MSLATRARTVHARQMKTAFAETVTFQRGSKTCTITNAVRQEQSDGIVGPDGVVTHASMVVWLLPQAEVLIDSVAVEPRLNDRIIPADGKSYEPLPPGKDLPAVIPHCGTEFWLVNSKRMRE